MVNYTARALTLALFSTTVLSTAAWAQPAPAPVDATPQTPETQSPAPGTNATDVTSNPNVEANQQQENNEIVVTATKREERLQNVPQSVIALGTKRLDQLNISNFDQYTCLLYTSPS